MHNRNIGDSLDLAKRYILGLLSRLRKPAVVAPLAPETNFDLESYGRVLGIGAGLHALVSRQFRRPHRPEYLEFARRMAVGNSSTLLLDPSSGLTENVSPSSRHISCVEALGACKDIDLWLIYHHQSAGRLGYCRAAQLVEARFFYDLGKAAMLVGGKSECVQLLMREIETSLVAGRVGPACLP